MEIFEIIKTRRTIHNYLNEKVPEAILRRAIGLGILAPNHRQTRPWKFYWAGQQTKGQLAQLAIDLKNKKAHEKMTQAQEVSVQAKYNQGELIIAAIKKSDNLEILKEDYASLACALQNMALYLWSEGYGTKWATGGIIRNERTYKILNIASESEVIEGFFWIGKPKEIPERKDEVSADNFFEKRD